MNETSTNRTLFLLLVLAAATSAGTGSQATFSSPDEAAKALVAAVESGNYPLFLTIAGTRMAEFWSVGDPVRDVLERERFLDEAHRNGIITVARADDQKVLYVGNIEEPFPAPLMKTGSGWRFDGQAGSVELAARRTRRNENAAVELCRRFRDAEFAYLGSDHRGTPTFAQTIRSTPGQRDGLFWNDAGGEDESPLGPFFASAAFAEKQSNEEPRPLFGYYFKILLAQGPDAYGGALDYCVKGRLRKGFALIAWPAEYGVDGVRSFLINHFGDVYQKDMGPDTSRMAECMEVFNPDRSWTRVAGYR